MLATFEQVLKKKCEQNPELSALPAQWEFDRRLVADALQTVVRTFPHYSRHDASHSNTILERIGRVLGPKRIEMLSATDIWLLLEAAYQHDIGMVVTDEQMRAWWGTPHFKDYLTQLQHHSDPELREAARQFSSPSPPRDLVHGWPIKVSRSLTLAIAEYARRQHAANAERIIQNPEGTIGMPSPRTPLISARLFSQLGRICALHGGSFEETMKLPAREMGPGGDDAHPRFVAFMLRLGDLLDLDNGRFCPMTVRSFGALPVSSLAHFEKHAATNHFWVSPEEIEVEAECHSYEAYEAAYQWFEWLRGELKNQIAHWPDILPSPDFGDLPSPKKIQAQLKGLLTLEPGKRPRFEVDREQILKLVRGANIYTSRLGCMRELLQNAVDATLIRFWREHWSRLPREELAKRTPADLRRALEAFPIRVEVRQVEAAGASKKARFSIAVEDAGTGISLSDVRYIQSIGASQKNPERQRIIEDMPEWMRPSGAFGIGLQSVFLFTDKVLVRTRQHASGKALELILQNGAGSGTDGFSIRELDEEPARLPVGTRIEFEVELDRLLFARSEIPPSTDASMDPILEQEFPYEAVLLGDIGEQMARACACPIEVRSGKKPEWRRLRMVAPFEDAYFDPETNLEISLQMRRESQMNRVRFYYRGAPLRSSLGGVFRLLRVTCNIHQGRADQLLLLSRERLTPEAERRVVADLERTVPKFLPRYVQGLRAQQPGTPELELASLCAWLLDLEASVAGEEWRGIRIGGDDGMSLGELVSQNRVDQIPVVRLSEEMEVRTKAVGHIELVHPSANTWMKRVLEKAFPYHGFTGRRAVHEGRERPVFVFGRRPEDAAITNEGLRLLLSNVSDAALSGTFVRATIPCPERYSVLRYAVDAESALFFSHVGGIRSRMVCPFVELEGKGVTLPNLGKLVEWTARNAEGGPRSEKEVAKALWDFIQDMDRLMADVWKRKEYSLDTARRELSRWLD